MNLNKYAMYDMIMFRLKTQVSNAAPISPFCCSQDAALLYLSRTVPQDASMVQIFLIISLVSFFE